MRSVVEFRTGYFDRALTDLGSVLDQAEADLADVDFDTIVGTGFSGGVIIPSLALRLGKNFALIRKETDDSHHGRGRLVGTIGERWIFVDDFISSGATRTRVLDKVATGASLEDFETDYVGQYCYQAWSEETERYGLFTSVEEYDPRPKPEPEPEPMPAIAGVPLGPEWQPLGYVSYDDTTIPDYAKVVR